MDCIFCKIINKEIHSDKVYEDEKVLAFNDLDPKAPVHILVIPKEHIENLDEINEKNSNVVAHIYEVIAKLAKELNLNNGYRVVVNCKQDGGQTVNHLHFHVLGGRSMTWPPG